MSLPVTLAIGNIGSTCYPDDPQALADAIVAAMSGTIAFSFGGVIYSASEPDPSYRGNTGWFDLNDFNLYFWNSTEGAWVRPHACPPSGKERRIWVGNTTELLTYDGADVDAGANSTGAFWEVDTAFQARFPLGAGTLPISTTVVANQDTGGVEKYVLTPDEMQHMHGVGTDGLQDDPFNMLHRNWNTAPTTYIQRYNDLSDLSGTGWLDGPAISSGTGGTTRALADETVSAHQNMPPYYGVYFIKRTSRIYHIAP